MIDVSMKVHPKTLAEFNHLINEMVEVTGAEQSKVVRNAARDLARAAIKHTGMAPKTRSNKVNAIDITEYSRRFERRRGNSRTPYWIKTLHRYTGEHVVFPGTLEESEKYSREDYKGRRYTVKSRGFLKAGWVKALYDLGVKGKGMTAANIKTFSKYGAAFTSDARGKGGTPWAVLQNYVPFIEDYNNGRNKEGTPKHILEKSMRDVNAKMTQRLEKMSKKILKAGKAR